MKGRGRRGAGRSEEGRRGNVRRGKGGVEEEELYCCSYVLSEG